MKRTTLALPVVPLLAALVVGLGSITARPERGGAAPTALALELAAARLQEVPDSISWRLSWTPPVLVETSPPTGYEWHVDWPDSVGFAGPSRRSGRRAADVHEAVFRTPRPGECAGPWWMHARVRAEGSWRDRDGEPVTTTAWRSARFRIECRNLVPDAPGLQLDTLTADTMLVPGAEPPDSLRLLLIDGHELEVVREPDGAVWHRSVELPDSEVRARGFDTLRFVALGEVRELCAVTWRAGRAHLVPHEAMDAVQVDDPTTAIAVEVLEDRPTYCLAVTSLRTTDG